MIFKFIVLLCVANASVEAARILFVHPTVSKSHVLSMQALSVVLAEKGHDVTYVSAYPLNKKIQNYREIHIPNDETHKLDLQKSMIQNPKETGFLKSFSTFINIIFSYGETFLESEQFKKLKNEKFDLLVVGYFVNDAIIGLGDHFNCPTIMVSPGGILGSLYDVVGNPMDVNGFPHVMINDKNMDFSGRIKTFLFAGIETLFTKYFKYRSRQLYKLVLLYLINARFIS
jgi:glucuronosyltransferase